MASRLNPYLNFKDNTREAMEFYKSVFGGELTISTFGDFQMAQDPSEKDKVMHSQLETPQGFVLMAADTPNYMEFKPGTNFAVSLSGDDEDLLNGLYAKLAEGGNVTMPLSKAEWGDSFGMLVDKFGTSWLFNISTPR